MTTTVSPDARRRRRPAAPTASPGTWATFTPASTTRGSTRTSQAALKRAEAFETAYRGKIDVPAARRRPAGAAMHELESLSEQMDRPAVYASCARRQDRRPAARRPAGPHPRAAHRHQQAPDLLRPGMGQAADDGGQAAPRRAGPGPLPPLSGTEARLAAALPQRAGREDPRREDRHRPGRLRAPVRRNRRRPCASRSSTAARRSC